MNCGIFPTVDSDILYVNFNQDYSCMSVGTRKGFRIYNCDPFGKCFDREDGAVGICEMLFSSSLVAIVGAGDPPQFSPRKLQIVNTKRQTVVCELNFPTKILSVLINRKRLVVTLEEKMHIYDLGTMKVIHTIDTAVNHSGIGALSYNNEEPLLAYPTKSNDGSIEIFNTITLQPVFLVQAHKSAVSKISFSLDGALLATASDRGTIIRVFDSNTGMKLYQFRRGTYPANIHSLSFSLNSQMLCVSSDSDTIHIFKLDHQRTLQSSSTTTTTSASTTSTSNIFGAILPEKVGGALESTSRDFAHLKLPSSNLMSLCVLSGTVPRVMVITSKGQFLIYEIDYEKGGLCKLLKQHSIIPLEDLPK